MIRIGLIYARTSKDTDDAFSVDSQVKRCCEYAQTHGIEVPEEFVFREDFTGFKLDRPEFNKVRKLVAEKAVECVIIYQTDRLARRSFHAQQILQEEMIPNGVELHIVSWGRAVENTPQDIAFFGIQAEFAQMERGMIVERTLRGVQQKLEDGVWHGAGQDRYGYKKVGKKRETRMLIREDEARVVRMIRDWFLKERLSVAQIAERLNRQRIPPPSVARNLTVKRKDWSPRSVYTVISDEVYTGVWTYGKKGSRKNPVRLEFPELALITKEEYRQIRERFAEGRRRYAPGPKHEYLLARHTKCFCGRAVNAHTITFKERGVQYKYYRCNGARSYAYEKCTLPQISVPKADARVWGEVEKLLNDPDAIIAGYERLRAIARQANEEAEANIEAGRRLLGRYRASLKKYAEMYDEDLITKELLREKKAELDGQIRQAERELAEYEAALLHVISDEEIQDRVRTIRLIKQRLDELGTLDFKDRRRVIELLNIEAVFGREDGKVYVEVIWYGEVIASLWVEDVNTCSACGPTRCARPPRSCPAAG